MSFRSTSLILLGLGNLVALAGCSSSDAPAAAGTGGATCDTVDYSTYKTAAVPSFETDIMPIFGASCTASDCHNSHDKKAGLDLGVRCQGSGSGATFKCVFPTTPPDPSSGQTNPPQPLTSAIMDAVRASLLLPAKTVNAPDGGPYKVMRVVPGDPAHSFVMQKVDGTENSQGYACTNQDPSHTASPKPCGDPMPLNSPPLCEGTSRAKFDLLAAWIQGGAPR